MRKIELYISLGLAFILRLFQLGKAGYWYDEGFTVSISRLPFSRMMAATAGDVHPPGFYLTTWLTARISDSEFVMRLPSVIFSIGAVYLTWKLVKEFNFSRLAQIAVVSWIVISPIQLHYAQEVRMYALLQLEVLLLVYLLLKREWIWFGLVSTLMLYTHNYGLFYLPTLGLFSLVRDYKKGIKKIVGYLPAFFIPLLLWIPWMVVLINQMATLGETGYWIQSPTVASIFFTFYQLMFAYSMPQVFQGIAVIVMASLILYSIWKIGKDQPDNWLYLVILVLGPMGLSLVGSVVWRSIFLFRGFIGSAIPLVMLVVLSVDQIRTDYKKYYLLSIIASVLVAGLIGHYLYNAENKGDTYRWIGMIKENWKDGDVILSLNDNGVVAVNTYAEGFEYFKVPPCEQESLGSLSPKTRKALGVIEKDLEEIDAERVWYISTVSPVSSQCEVDKTREIIQDNDTRLVNTLADSEYREAGVYLINGKH